MSQPTATSTYFDSIGVEIRGNDALATVRRLRSLFFELTRRQCAHPHHPHQRRLATLPCFDSKTWAPGMPLCLRFSLGYFDHPALVQFVAALAAAGATVHRLDVAVDRPLGTQLVDVVLVGRPGARWYKPRGYQTRYVGREDDELSFAAYSDRPSKLAPDGPCVLHVEARLQDQHVPPAVRNDVRTLITLDPIDVVSEWIRCRRKWRFYSPDDRLLEAMRWLASERGFLTASDAELANLSDTPESTCRRRISALAGARRIVVLRRRQGRGRRTRYRLAA